MSDQTNNQPVQEEPSLHQAAGQPDALPLHLFKALLNFIAVMGDIKPGDDEGVLPLLPQGELCHPLPVYQACAGLYGRKGLYGGGDPGTQHHLRRRHRAALVMTKGSCPCSRRAASLSRRT